jgi:hypothetical protein
MVAARTTYEPHAMCGTKSRTSMRNERRDRSSVNMLSMKMPRRYRGECEGEWKCAAAARPNITSVKRAATGWMMRMAERLVLVPVGRSKLEFWAVLMSGDVLSALYLYSWAHMQLRTWRKRIVLTRIISNLDTAAWAPLAVTKDSKIHIVERGEGNLLDDWGGEDWDKKQDESHEQQHRQRGRGAQHGDAGEV